MNLLKGSASKPTEVKKLNINILSELQDGKKAPKAAKKFEKSALNSDPLSKLKINQPKKVVGSRRRRDDPDSDLKNRTHPDDIKVPKIELNSIRR
jgi:hypothetical protein